MQHFMLDINETIAEKMKKWKGKITFTNFLIEGEEAENIKSMLANAVDIPFADFEKHFNRLTELCSVKEKIAYSQIVQVGREVFARILVGDTTYTGIINYGLLGTASTGVTDGDTQLAAEVKRKGVATRTRSGDTLTFRFFYSKSDTNGTYQEFGTVIDGTASANTGQLFNRALTGGWIKTSLEALTVTVQFDLNPA